MTSISIMFNGIIWSSWWNCWEYVADRLTWWKKPRSANIRVQRSLREVNARRASALERYDNVSINARSASSSNTVIIFILPGRVCLSCVLYMLCQCSVTVGIVLLFSFICNIRRTAVSIALCSFSWRKRPMTHEHSFDFLSLEGVNVEVRVWIILRVETRVFRIVSCEDQSGCYVEEHEPITLCLPYTYEKRIISQLFLCVSILDSLQHSSTSPSMRNNFNYDVV